MYEIIALLYRRRLALYLLLAFAAGAVASGLFFHRRGSDRIGELDTRYSAELRGATETIRGLEKELNRERDLNRELREHNNRAGELVEGLTGRLNEMSETYRKQSAYRRNTKKARSSGSLLRRFAHKTPKNRLKGFFTLQTPSNLWFARLPDNRGFTAFFNEKTVKTYKRNRLPGGPP